MRKLWHASAWIIVVAVVLAIVALNQRRGRLLRVMEYHKAQQYGAEARAAQFANGRLAYSSVAGGLPNPVMMPSPAIPFPAGPDGAIGQPDDLIDLPGSRHPPMSRRSWVGREQILAEYHRQLRAKYRAAARRPWASVSPDPAPPE